jgi:transposase
VLADHGLDRAGGFRSGVGRAWLAELSLPPVSRTVIEDCLAVIDGLQPIVDRLDVEVAARAKADPRVQILTRLPGVGPFTALVILAEVGDITRFRNAGKLGAWAGLTPTVRGSELTVRHGHISKQGSAWLRWILIEAAQTAKRSPAFAPTYQAIARRRGKKIATTAVARKLLARAYHLLVQAEATPAGAPRTTSTHAPAPAGTPATDREGRTPGRARSCGMSRPSRARSSD